ncbi:MAG TPA: VCBS repeat-containing protein, partial [Chitinophagaceae bacterium]|nr:VCBS repeat-containing protein [Chitinophagaceae bacterium]
LLKKQSTNLDNETGWWNSITATDLDNDGDMDYIMGNYGMNGYYKANSNEPVNIYAKDYDGNGHTDMLLSQWRAETPHGTAKEFPASLRDMVTEELPVIKKQFSTYSAYAKAAMTDVLKNFNRDGELKLSANNLQTVWIENKGNYNFQLHALPAPAQWSPVYGIAVNDFNSDGNPDIIISGNEYGMAPVNGRSDAMNGLVLQGDGKGNFTPLTILQSGIMIPGNGKALIQFPAAKNIAIAAAQNGGALKFFRSNNNVQNILLQPDEIYAIITLKNGQKRKEEFYYGSSFLSQSARFVSFNASVQSVTIFNSKGQSRNMPLQ